MFLLRCCHHGCRPNRRIAVDPSRGAVDSQRELCMLPNETAMVYTPSEYTDAGFLKPLYLAALVFSALSSRLGEDQLLIGGITSSAQWSSGVSEVLSFLSNKRGLAWWLCILAHKEAYSSLRLIYMLAIFVILTNIKK